MSRTFESDEDKSKRLLRDQKDARIKDAKYIKHVLSKEDKNHWHFANGDMRELPAPYDRKKLFTEFYELLNHHGPFPTYYEMRKYYYWPGIKQTKKNVCSKCTICVINNRKPRKGCNL